MSEIVLVTMGNFAAAELEPRATSRTMVENLVIRLDQGWANFFLKGPHYYAQILKGPECTYEY